MRCGIYVIRNQVSGRCYVGQSIDIDTRWRNHRYDAETRKKTKLLDALRSYGLESFAFEVLELCERSQLNDRETHWIGVLDSFHNGYNLLDSSKGPRRLAEPTRKRFVAAQVGKKRSPESIAKAAAKNRGHIKSEATRQKLSASLKGRVFSEEHRRRISIAKSHPSPEARKRNSEAQRRRKPTTLEARMAMSRAGKGRPKSAEHRAKIALGHIRFHERQRSEMQGSLL